MLLPPGGSAPKTLGFVIFTVDRNSRDLGLGSCFGARFLGHPVACPRVAAVEFGANVGHS